MKTATENHIYLPTKNRWVSQKLHDEVLTLAKAFRPSMKPGHSYLVQTMLGNRFWLPLSTRKRIDAGLIMMHLSETNELPICPDESKSGPKKFQLRH